MRTYHYQLLLMFIIIGCNEIPYSGKNENPAINTEAKEIYQKGDTLYYQNNYRGAMSFYREALGALADSSEHRLLSSLINDIGLCYKKMGAFDSALFYYKAAAIVDLENQDSATLVGRWSNMAIVYKNIGLYSDAVLYLNKSLLFIHERDSSSRARVYNSLGGTFLKQRRFDQAKSYYTKALDLFEKLGKTKRAASALNNLGLIAEGRDDLDSAMIFFRESLRQKAILDSSLLPATIHNIGKVFRQKKELDSSNYYLELANKLRVRFSDQNGLALGKLELSKNKLDQGNSAKAKQFLDAAYSYAKASSNQTLLSACLNQYSIYYEAVENPVRSLSYLRSWVALEDSLFNQEKIKSLDYRYSFETDRLKEEKLLLESSAVVASDKARSRFLVIVLMTGFTLVLLIFILVILRQRSQMRKLNLELNAYNERIASLNKQNFHFTKNSLTGIVSMLNKQIRRVEGERVKGILIEEKLRMESINMLYQQLFYKDGSEVNVKEFLSGIVQNTIETMLPDHEVLTELSIDEESVLNNEKAFNVGLIVNEICINSCKYALTKGKQFFLKWKNGEGETILSLGDDGAVLQDFDLNSSKSFGLQLIRLLLDDMNALVKTNTTNGLEYSIRFKS